MIEIKISDLISHSMFDETPQTVLSTYPKMVSIISLVFKIENFMSSDGNYKIFKFHTNNGCYLLYEDDEVLKINESCS